MKNSCAAQYAPILKYRPFHLNGQMNFDGRPDEANMGKGAAYYQLYP
jgi:hypothetical protein